MVSREDAQRAGELIAELRRLNERLADTNDRDERLALHQEMAPKYDELARLIPAY